MQSLYEKLGVSKKVIDDSKGNKESGLFTRFSDSAPAIANYNLMSDLLELPVASYGYKYLFVIVDIAGNGHFDIEPLKTKTATVCLKALKTIFSREIVKKPYFSVATDAGSEFKGDFNQYLMDNGIYHKVSTPDRKTQNSPVESLNRILGRYIFAYLNQKEIDTGKTYRNWFPIVGLLREELNRLREKPLKPMTFDNVPALNVSKKPKFKADDMVQYRLNTPQDFLGHKNIGGFREGDKKWSEPTRITKLLIYAGDQPYRYLVEGNTHASYTAEQLRRA